MSVKSPSAKNTPNMQILIKWIINRALKAALERAVAARAAQTFQKMYHLRTNLYSSLR